LQPVSITSGVGLALAAAAILTLAAPTDGRQIESASDTLAATLNRAGGWEEQPAYLALFAPPAHRAAYRAFVAAADREAALRALAGAPGMLRPNGAWAPRSLLPFDAFGQGGLYDRWKLARLYGSRRAQVARGPRQNGVQGLESWTLVSPYPDPALTRLLPGTLLLVLRLP
jgi:hypothetical protein